MVISLAKRSVSRMISSKALRSTSARSRGFFAAQRSMAMLGRIDRGTPSSTLALATDRDRLLGRGIDHVEALVVGGLAPFAADVEIGWNICEQIVVHRFPPCRAISAVAIVALSRIRCTVGKTASSRTSAAGSGICGVVMRTGGPSRS